jgi:hypothetical protein
MISSKAWRMLAPEIFFLLCFDIADCYSVSRRGGARGRREDK